MLPVLRGLRKRRHRDRTEQIPAPTPKRRRPSGIKDNNGDTSSPPKVATPRDPSTPPQVSSRSRSSSSLYTPESARTLSPWASSSPAASHKGAQLGAPSSSWKGTSKDRARSDVKGKRPLSLTRVVASPGRHPRIPLRSPKRKRHSLVREPRLPGVKESDEGRRLAASETGQNSQDNSKSTELVVAVENGSNWVEMEILEDEKEQRRQTNHDLRFVVPRGLEDEGDSIEHDMPPARDESELLNESATTFSFNHSHLNDVSANERTFRFMFERDPSVLSYGDVSHNISKTEISDGVSGNSCNSKHDSITSLSSLSHSIGSPDTSAERVRYLLSTTSCPPSTITHIMSLLNPLPKSITALNSTNRALEKQCERLVATVDELEGENDELREQNRRLMLERSVATAHAAQLELELETLRSRLEAKGEKIVKLRGTLKKIVRL